MSLKNTKNNDIYDIFDFLVDFDWDKNFYKFTRDEKDMYPYSVNKNEDNSVTIVHNVLGLNKEDLKLSTKIADGKGWIIIEGETKDDITGKTYSINSKFNCDLKYCDLNKISSSMKNGLLYITIAPKKNDSVKTKFINID